MNDERHNNGSSNDGNAKKRTVRRKLRKRNRGDDKRTSPGAANRGIEIADGATTGIDNGAVGDSTASSGGAAGNAAGVSLGSNDGASGSTSGNRSNGVGGNRARGRPTGSRTGSAAERTGSAAEKSGNDPKEAGVRIDSAPFSVGAEDLGSGGKEKSKRGRPKQSGIGRDAIQLFLERIYALPAQSGYGDHWFLAEAESKELAQNLSDALKTLPNYEDHPAYKLIANAVPWFALAFSAYSITYPRILMTKLMINEIQRQQSNKTGFGASAFAGNKSSPNFGGNENADTVGSEPIN